jgi:hypothetical protein
VPEAERKDFYLFVEEFSHFATTRFKGMLSESRKYGLNLTLATQLLAQMEEDMPAAVFGKVGTLIALQIGAEDAEYLAREFAPVFGEEDLISLPVYHIYLKLRMEGKTSRPFSGVTLEGPSFSQDENFH